MGGVCRKDIHEFALSHDKVDTYIHPGPTLYHFDVMQNWQYKQQNIIFFVSFGLQHISYLLQNAQLPGHRLILLRSDSPGQSFQKSRAYLPFSTTGWTAIIK